MKTGTILMEKGHKMCWVCVDSCLENIILLFTFKVSMSADSSDTHLYFRPVKDSVLWRKQTSWFGHDNICFKYLMIRINVVRSLVSRIYVNWAVHIYIKILLCFIKALRPLRTSSLAILDGSLTYPVDPTLPNSLVFMDCLIYNVDISCGL